MDDTLLVALLIAGFILYQSTQNDNADDPQAENLPDMIMTNIDEAVGAAQEAISGPVPVAGMSTSQAMLSMLMARESYRGTPYQLKDGAGMTWGYGHKGQAGETVPSYISQDDAGALFANDVVNRAEKWVKLYVTVPQTQNQFDALVSIAFNMTPQSFRKFADSVNAGNGIDGIAQASVSWPDPSYRNGIQIRRNTEMNVYDNGVYA